MVDEALARAYDLEEYGLAWDRTDVEKYYMSMTGGGTFVRTLGSIDEGIGITEVMLHQLHKRGIRICDFHMLADVIRDEKGNVAGGPGDGPLERRVALLLRADGRHRHRRHLAALRDELGPDDQHRRRASRSDCAPAPSSWTSSSCSSSRSRSSTRRAREATR
jgi:hypothetical protein